MVRGDSAAPHALGGAIGNGVGGGIGAVLVVKNLDAAKTRLAASLPIAGIGRGPVDHRALVLAMLLDTMTAVHLAGLDPIVVVSPDAEVLGEVTAAGAHAVREVPRTDPSLNHAYAEGIDWIRRHRPECPRVLLVQADLPAADAHSIRQVIDAAGALPQALVTDAAGDGTAMLLRPVELNVLPRFGIDSAAAHRADGAVDLDATRSRWADLRTDVDTAADLRRAWTLGLGRHTRAALGIDPSHDAGGRG